MTERPDLAGVITACQPRAVRENTLVLGALGTGIDPAQLGDAEAARAAIEDAVRQVVAKRWSVAPLASASGPSAASGPGDARNEAYRTAQQHPLVQDLLRRFEADIIGREKSHGDGWRQRVVTSLQQPVHGMMANEPPPPPDY